MIFRIKYKLREEWAPIIGTIPNLASIDEHGEGPAIVTFNFDNKAAMSVWAINPNNVSDILKVFAKYLKK